MNNRLELTAMEKIDRRIRRSQRLLMDALVALSLEKSYDAVTIRDITERADVSYSTFFRHFPEKDALLAALLKSVVDDFKQLINHNPDRSPEAEGALIFHYVQQQQAFFRVLFSSQGTSRVLDDVQHAIVADVLHTFPAGGLVPPEIVANHLVMSILALIRWWLDHDLPYPVERMAAIYSRLIVQGITLAVSDSAARSPNLDTA